MVGVAALYRARIDSGQISADPAQAAAVEMLDRLAHQLDGWRPGRGRGLFARAVAPPRGIWLWGGVGRGKSMLMDLFFEAAPIVPKRRVHFHAFMQEVHSAVSSWRSRPERDKARHPQRNRDDPDDPVLPVARMIAQGATLLCFDEFQVTDIADAMILGRLFAELFEQGVVVVTTSNRHPDELYRNGLNRQLFVPFIDRIKQQLDLFALEGPRDYRLQRLEQEPVYHAPLGPAAADAMDRAWTRMTHGAEAEAQVLLVAGRELEVRRAAGGCARFAFEELCARPLGAGDYLAIARQFHTVLLEGVPKLGASLRDQAARFRNLIDALYENRTKLIVSADAEPDRLYTEGVQSFEFERTASRLYEMRSHAYLAQRRGDDD